MASSLNVELVHIILKGVKKLNQLEIEEALPTEEDRASMNRQQLEAKVDKENCDMMRVIRLNRIKIKDPEKWDQAKF